MWEIGITVFLTVYILCALFGDSLADYLEAKAEELRARAERLREENDE